MESYKISKTSQEQYVLQEDNYHVKWKDIRFYLEEKKIRRILIKDKILSLFFIPVVIAIVLILWSIFCWFFNERSYFLEDYEFICAYGVSGHLCPWESGYDYVVVDYMTGVVAVVSIPLCILLLLLISSFAFRKAYNIESTATSESKYILVQDKDGKMGLFKKTWLKFVKTLDFKYDNIIRCTENSYLCWSGNKCGVYNTSLHKMVLPLEYDSISLAGEDIVDTEKDGFSRRFTTKGYRVNE